MNQSLSIKHATGSYDVHFMPLQSAFKFDPSWTVIADDAVLKKYHANLAGHLNIIGVPSGESSKSIEEWGRLVRELAARGVKRGDRIVALGGGVIGDLVGFVCATYMRGVRFIQVPTTLLAQVDSSVGGKVGIDLPEGKNLAGAFYPPSEVRICQQFIEELPKRQVVNGTAEVLKYGFIMAPGILHQVAHGSVTEDIVRTCIECKKAVVEEDEFETTGLRAILNFGHTVGHAIELGLNYRELLHGEAISIGMVVEARLGEQLGLSPTGTARQVERALDLVGLPTHHPITDRADQLIPLMQRDKKTASDGLYFSLLTGIGSCKLVGPISPEQVAKAFHG